MIARTASSVGVALSKEPFASWAAVLSTLALVLVSQPRVHRVDQCLRSGRTLTAVTSTGWLCSPTDYITLTVLRDLTNGSLGR